MLNKEYIKDQLSKQISKVIANYKNEIAHN